MIWLFWFLVFTIPLLGVVVVAVVGLRLWRQAKAASREVGTLTERLAAVGVARIDSAHRN